MSLTIAPMETRYLEDAAALVGERYLALCRQVPVLPLRYAERDILLPMLQDVLAAGPSVVAIENARLVGFMAGFPIGAFRGEPAAISPEWGNGALMDESSRILSISGRNWSTTFRPNWSNEREALVGCMG